MELYFQGAESKVYVTEYLGKKAIAKERFHKKYRNAQLDQYLILERIRSECRNIIRCKQAGIKTPTLYFVDWGSSTIYMEYFDTGTTVKDYIDGLQATDTADADTSLRELSNKIGEILAKMHKNGIVHGDLTSSNMLLVKEQIVMIDFGLSDCNCTAEDKGVDLYVLEKALLSTHANIEIFFQNILDAYKKSAPRESTDVLHKLDDIRLRGRKRVMVG